MDTDSLKYFMEIARIGSINKASEELDYAPSSLIYKMNALERELGIQLLIRKHNGVFLSPEALQLQPYFKNIVDAENILKQQIDEILGHPSSNISIACLTSTSIDLLPAIVKKIHSTNLGINMEVKVMGYNMSELVEKGELDFGITDSEHVGNNDWIPLKQEPFYVAMLATSELAQYDVVPVEALKHESLFLPTGNPKNNSYIALKDLIVKDLKFSQEGGNAILSLVANGIGVTVLPSSYEKSCPSNVIMKPLDPPIYRTLGLITRDLSSLSSTKKAFVKQIKAMKLQL